MRNSLLPALFLVASTPVLAQPGFFLSADLQYALHVCSDTVYVGDQPGSGAVADLNIGNRGCLIANEREGVWMHFQVATGGQLGFTITPLPNMGHDFAVWGPFSAPVTSLESSPVRCSWADVPGATGMNFTAVDITEGAIGDSWVRYLDVLPGEWYTLYVDKFYLVYALNFALTWQLQGGASLACLEVPEVDFAGPVEPVLPGELVGFTDASTNFPYAWSWVLPGGTPSTSTERDPQGIVYTQPGCHDVQLTVYNAAGSASITRPCAVEVELNTGVAAVGPAAFTLRQEADVLRVLPTDLSTIAEVRVLDLRGRVVVTATGTGAQEVQVGQLGAGAYVVEVLQGGGRATRTVVL